MAEAVAILLVMGYLFYDYMWAGLLYIPYIVYYVRNGMCKHERRRRDRLAAEFKDGIQAVVSALTAGYSIENSFREALAEIGLLYGTKTEIYKEFSQIVYQLNLNVNIEEAFERFALKCNVEEINNFSEILQYAKRSGGNLIQIIKNTTDTISEKIDVKREISTIISAKQLEQTIMNFVPIGIILYMRLTSPEMFEKMYGNMFGIIFMSICLVLYLVAGIIAQKLVDIQI